MTLAGWSTRFDADRVYHHVLLTGLSAGATFWYRCAASSSAIAVCKPLVMEVRAADSAALAAAFACSAALAREISALTGQTEDEYKSCVGNTENQQKLIERYNTAIDLGVDGTPRIYINGELYTPNRGWSQIGDEIARLVKKLKV